MGKRGPKARTVLERFAQKIALTDSGCIEWLAGTNGDGYGQEHLTPAEGSRKVYAHRWSYEYHVGPIPEGMTIDHLCRNTRCVNPEHLELVTPAENSLRGMGSPAVNARKTHCQKGHALTGDNLRVRPSGGRRCRQCDQARDRARRSNKKAA